MNTLPHAFQALGMFKQFINYKLVPDGKGKTQKKPINPSTGEVHNPHDPAIWTNFDNCVGKGDGVGFVLTENDPFFFVDIDKCAEAGEWSDLAKNLMTLCAGCAVEVSQSGTGLHILGMGKFPEHACKNTGLNIELYTSERFVALTGRNAVGNVATTCTRIDELVNLYFKPTAATTSAEWTDGPVEEWNGHESDDQLITHALAVTGAAAAFGNKASFRDLWECDEEKLALAYPDLEGSRAYDGSSADAALAQHLAFWTGMDCERMLRLMEKSGLVRDKWERDDYLRRTILSACGRCEKVYIRTQPDTTAPGQVTEATPRQRGGLMFADEQLELFKGCVYMRDLHRVFVPDGSVLKPEQFRAYYAGWTFVLDDANSKVTTDAWKAFTESQILEHPRVLRPMFRPDLEPGLVFEYNGHLRVNNYVPAKVEKRPGDVSLFLDHLRRVLPDERDQMILLAFMAACVQHKGVKFQWCVLLQGIEGNGKTLFSRIVAEAIGMTYVHSPRATEITNKFNSWMRDKLFVYIEDVYIPGSKREVLETLKPIITNDWQAVEMKGVDQSLEYVVANMMLNSNHRDAIQISDGQRRFCVFYTAQQEEGDLQRDGMTGEYFDRLYTWLRDGGYANVAHFLENYDIPDELNPAKGAKRAPKSSTYDQVIESSRGRVEQEIIEAISNERAGFCGGWVSSMALDTLLEEKRLASKVPPNKRKDLMQSLGYRYHPKLKNGRVNNVVMPDNGKPRLFIKNGHISNNYDTAAQVARAYSDAQKFDGGLDAQAAFGG